MPARGPILLLGNPRGAVDAGAVSAAAHCRALALETFPAAARDADLAPVQGSHRAPGRCGGERVRSAGCCRPGSSGTPRTRRTNAPPSWRHPTFDWPLSRRGRAAAARAPRRDAAERAPPRARRSPDYLPAQGEARRSAVRGRRPQRERAAVRFRSTAIAATEPAAEVGLGRIARARGPARRGHPPLRAGGRAVSRAGRRVTTRLAGSYRARWAAPPTRSARPRQHARYGARWPRLDDPVLRRRRPRLREDARATLASGA